MLRQVMETAEDHEVVLVMLASGPVPDDRLDRHPVMHVERHVPVERTTLVARILRRRERHLLRLLPHMLVTPRTSTRRGAAPLTLRSRTATVGAATRLHRSTATPPHDDHLPGLSPALSTCTACHTTTPLSTTIHDKHPPTLRKTWPG